MPTPCACITTHPWTWSSVSRSSLLWTRQESTKLKRLRTCKREGRSESCAWSGETMTRRHGKRQDAPSGFPWPYQCLHEWEDGWEQERLTSEVLVVLRWTRWRMWFCKDTDNDCLQTLLPQIALRPRQSRWECFDLTAALRLTRIIYWLHGGDCASNASMQNDFSFLPKLSLGLDIWEVSIVSRSFALDGPKRLAAAGLEPGIHRTQE